MWLKEMKTLGDELRRRLELGLLQREITECLGVSEVGVWQWERNRTEPQVQFLPAIYDFLGYAPWQQPDGFADWLRQARRWMGLSRRKLAARIGVDPTTVDRWERGHGQPSPESQQRLRMIMGVA
jgi:transcriptional regulator with XRE-family HTH domain